MPDDRYTARRAGALVVAVECGKPLLDLLLHLHGHRPRRGTRVRPRPDRAARPAAHRFYVRVGSDAGAELLERAGWSAATDDDRRARTDVVDGARAGMGRSLQTEGLAALLARNLEHPRWAEVAERCLVLRQLHPGLPHLLLQ